MILSWLKLIKNPSNIAELVVKPNNSLDRETNHYQQAHGKHENSETPRISTGHKRYISSFLAQNISPLKRFSSRFCAFI